MPTEPRTPRSLLLVTPLLLLAACIGSDAATSGVVEARRVVVSAEIGGRVLDVPVAEGARVAAGDVLARLECDGHRSQRDAALARLAQAEATALQATAQAALVDDGARDEEIDAARAERDAARQSLRMARNGATAQQRAQLQAALDAVDARLALATANHDRIARLAQSDAAAIAQLDAARAELDATTAERARAQAALDDASDGARAEERRIAELRVTQAEARLAALEAGARAPERDAATAQVAAARAAVDAARAGVAGAEWSVERCEIRAPIAGTIDIVAREVGELAAPGMPLFAVAADLPPELRTWANAAELSGLAVGDEVPVLLEVPGATPMRARIVHIADEAEFTASNVQTPDDRATLVWEVTLELPVAPGSIRPGTTATVDLGAAGSPGAPEAP